MGKALMVWKHINQTAIISGVEIGLYGAGGSTTTESQAQAAVTEAMTFDRLRANIFSGGSGTNTLQFRTNGANGALVASRSGTGVLEDLTHSDTLAANDLWNLAYTDTGTDSAFSWISGNVTFSSGHGNVHGAGGGTGAVWDVANSTQFAPICGTISADGTATEANAQWKQRGYSSWASAQCRIQANARTNTSTIRNRINGADGGFQIDFAAGVGGLVTDTTTADTIASGDLLDYSVTLGSGVQDLTVGFFISTLKSSAGHSETMGGTLNGTARAASATADYHPVGGGLGTAGLTEAQARLVPGFAARCANLRIYVSTNTYTGNATLKLYKNGSAVITTTITAGAQNQWFENTTDTVDISATDELSLELDEGTSGTITWHRMGLTLQDPTITGTGTPTAQAADVTGSGTSSSTGTGALVAQAATIDGTGTAGDPGVTGTGALASQATDVTGAGTSSSTGTGAPTAQAADVTGAGTSSSTGTGALTAPAADVTGAGTVSGGAIAGTGALNSQAADVTGAGTVTGVGELPDSPAYKPVLGDDMDREFEMLAKILRIEDKLEDIAEFAAEVEREGNEFVDLSKATKWQDDGWDD